LTVLLAGLVLADHITTWAEDRLYQDRAVFAQTTPYQRIVLTNAPGEGRVGYRLFLNGNLQFAQRDEYRYHEALVHPVMAAFSDHAAPKKVAVLGGGDGMAVREILKYPGVESITLVELDPAMTALFTEQPVLAALNDQALKSPKVRVIHADAFTWLEQSQEVFDVVVVDFPDPTNFSIGKLFTNAFYALLDKHLSSSGYAVIQTTSPLIARKSFWTVVGTIESTGLKATPYHAHVPSFGEWGFVIASRRPYRLPQALPGGLRFLNTASLPLLFDFPQDMARVPTEVNRLSNQVLVTTYEEEWGRVAP
jgi:spermidine synthase